MLDISKMRWKGKGKVISKGMSTIYTENEELHTNDKGLILNSKAKIV